jgi:hypothetical protein
MGDRVKKEGPRATQSVRQGLGRSLSRQLQSPSPVRVEEGERLTAMIAERIIEVLPPQEFRLRLAHPIISIDGIGALRGNGYSTAPAVLWYLPLSASRRLKLIFESQTRDLQRFLSNVRGAPWPGQGALPHVDVTSRAIHAWWGGSTEADAVISLRTISRDELGI